MLPASFWVAKAYHVEPTFRRAGSGKSLTRDPDVGCLVGSEETDVRKTEEDNNNADGAKERRNILTTVVQRIS